MIFNIIICLNEILCPEVLPTITKPNMTVSVIINNKTYNNIENHKNFGLFEKGALQSMSYKVELNPGEYEFGPNTEVEFVNFEQSTYGIVDEAPLGWAPGSLTVNHNIQLRDLKPQIEFSLLAEHSEGVTPNKLPSGTCEDKKIKANSLFFNFSLSQYITELYCGTSTNIINENNISSINSAFIRKLKADKRNYTINNSFNFTIPKGANSVIIAYPEYDINGRETNGPKSILNTTVNAEMKDVFTKLTEVVVASPTGYIDDEYATNYVILVYTPDSGAYQNEANIKVTLG